MPAQTPADGAKSKADGTAAPRPVRTSAFWLLVAALLLVWLGALFTSEHGPWIHVLLVAAVAATVVELRTRVDRNLGAREVAAEPKWDPLIALS